MVGQPDDAQESPSFQGLCVQDDGFLSEIIQTSCRLFHTNHRWPDYPRTFEEDVERAVQLAYRANVCPHTGKVRWFFLLCSDPARIAWEGAAEPLIAGSLIGSDVAGLAERGLVGRIGFLQVFFGGYLTHAGDFALAETYYQGLIAQGLRAEGLLGLADIHHTLANWREEVREYEDRRVYPRRAPIPASSAEDPLAKLEMFGFGQAIALYEQAVQAAPEGVSFYRLHLARACIDQGDLQRARTELQTAATAAEPNPFVDIYLNFVDRLIERPPKSSGEFLPTPELRERYHSLTAARLVDTDTLAMITGDEPVVLCEPMRLQGGYTAVVDGQPSPVALDLDYPAPKGLQLAVARDLGLGLKLAFEQFVVAEGPPVGLQRLKMFARPVLMTGEGHALIGLPRHEEVVRSDRPVAPLPGAGFNYYHWIIDAMGAASLLDRRLGPEAMDFIVNRPLNGWQKEILDLPLPGLRVHVLPGPTEHRVLVNAFHLPAPARLNVPHPEAVRLLRQRMSRHGLPRKGKRVWVGRPRTRGRATVNEGEIEDFLVRQGFERFDPASKSVSEQIAFFSDVEVLVSLGGAALTNLLFCPEETRVVILSTAFHYHETYTALAGAIGQPCWVCLAGSETRPNPYLIWSVFDQDVRLEDVAVAVDQAVRG
ncbi:MAG: glycosyltransferase 61 family protein [Caulobacteraceae bacterium]